MNNNTSNNENSDAKTKNLILESLGYKKDENNNFIKNGKKSIVYVRLSNGLIIKIDKASFTAYRLNNETSEWQEDSVLYTEYQYGELGGEEIDLEENYSYGEPYVFGGKLL